MIALEDYIHDLRSKLKEDITESDNRPSLVGVDIDEMKLKLKKKEEGKIKAIEDERRLLLVKQASKKKILSRSSTMKSMNSFLGIENGGIDTETSSPISKEERNQMSGSIIDERLLKTIILLQRYYRGYLGRKTVSSIMTLRIIRIFSPEDGRGEMYFLYCLFSDFVVVFLSVYRFFL
jgi:hypothetical protein